MFRQLDSARVIETVERLRDRIRERFPDANLGRVADDLVGLACAHAERCVSIARPDVPLRCISVFLLLAGAGAIALLFGTLRMRVDDSWTLIDTVQTLDSGLSMLFFLGAGTVFAISLELRRKRQRCLEALHEVRAMAHIVDMHQLTKDPDRLMRPGADTPASPSRTLSRFELSRYLDYCSEMLALMGKVAALYGQSFPDPVARQAVDEVEELTTALARKVWQKIMILGEVESGVQAEGA